MLSSNRGFDPRFPAPFESKQPTGRGPTILRNGEYLFWDAKIMAWMPLLPKNKMNIVQLILGV